MDQVLSDELRLWPLVHGSFRLPDTATIIRGAGLQAPGSRCKGGNTFSYDEALGRNNYVFLAPANLKGNYGFGTFLLVDPLILQEPGVGFAIYDVGEILRMIDWFLEGYIQEFPDWIAERELLEEMILAERAKIAEDFLDRIPPPPNDILKLLLMQKTPERLVTSESFRRYLDNYELTEMEFFQAIQRTCEKLGYTLSDYLRRSPLQWPLSEEILVFEKIDPEFLLGYWNGRNWIEWASAQNKDTSVRVDYFVATKLADLSRRP